MRDNFSQQRNMTGGKGGMPGAQGPSGMPTYEQFQSLPPWAQQFAQGQMKQYGTGSMAGGKGGMPGAQGSGSITPQPANTLPTSVM